MVGAGVGAGAPYVFGLEFIAQTTSSRGSREGSTPIRLDFSSRRRLAQSLGSAAHDWAIRDRPWSPSNLRFHQEAEEEIEEEEQEEEGQLEDTFSSEDVSFYVGDNEEGFQPSESIEERDISETASEGESDDSYDVEDSWDKSCSASENDSEGEDAFAKELAEVQPETNGSFLTKSSSSMTLWVRL